MQGQLPSLNLRYLVQQYWCASLIIYRLRVQAKSPLRTKMRLSRLRLRSIRTDPVANVYSVTPGERVLLTYWSKYQYDQTIDAHRKALRRSKARMKWGGREPKTKLWVSYVLVHIDAFHYSMQVSRRETTRSLQSSSKALIRGHPAHSCSYCSSPVVAQRPSLIAHRPSPIAPGRRSFVVPLYTRRHYEGHPHYLSGYICPFHFRFSNSFFS